MYAGGEDKSSVKNSTQHSQTRSPGLEYFGAANNRAAFLYIASPFILWKIQRQNHAVVSRAPRSEHVHPHAHDAAETPVILGS
jgi:hypothetical protein